MGIPVIDFSKLNGEERAETLAQIHTCCREWGFFQLVNHGIPDDLLDRVKKVSSECYKLEREEEFDKKSKSLEKLINQLNLEETADDSDEKKKNQQQQLQGVDWEDVFLLSDDNIPDWPSKTPGFKDTMSEYRSELKNLAEKVLEVMDSNLGLSTGYIKRAFDNNSNSNNNEQESSAFFGTKVSHYPPCPHADKLNGLRAHTDAGGVILLFQDEQVGGLQILKDGEWIDVQPIKNSIVINTGDQIEVISNGMYKSVWHRVVANREGNRRSIASFYNPNLEATIAPAQVLLLADDEEEGKGIIKEEMGSDHGINGNGLMMTEPLMYPKFVFGDYMSVYAEQKFQPKEPRFQAVRTTAAHVS